MFLRSINGRILWQLFPVCWASLNNKNRTESLNICIMNSFSGRVFRSASVYLSAVYTYCLLLTYLHLQNILSRLSRIHWCPAFKRSLANKTASSVTHGWFSSILSFITRGSILWRLNMHDLCELFLPNVCVLLFSFGFSE